MPRQGRCKSDQINFDTGGGPFLPYPSMPGFGLNIAPPDLGLSLPDGFPENIFDLLNKLKLRFPGGTLLQGQLDNFMKKLSQLIANLMTQMSVFMALFNIIMTIIQMIVCIIEVLCGAIVKIPVKLIKLFRQCIPAFLSIFPFLALVALILAIIAMLLALIEYIIAMLKKIYEELKRNFDNLDEVVNHDGNKAASIAIVRKISSILCILENVLMLFLLIKAIIDTIKDLLTRGIPFPCDDSDNGSGCDCCTSCSDLLMHPEGMKDKTLNITYTFTPSTLALPGIEVLTAVSPNFVAPYRFVDILGTTYSGCAVGPFFPPQPLDAVYINNPVRAPYLLTIDIPTTTGLGTRNITVSQVIISWVTNASASGTATLMGGTATDPMAEFTGWSLMEIMRGTQVVPAPVPGPVVHAYKDGYVNTLTVNTRELMVMNLVSADCIPEVRQERAAAYAGMDPGILDALTFPNIDLATSKMEAALSTLRSRFNRAAIDTFNAEMGGILNGLKDEAEATYTDTLDRSVNPLHCSATLDPDLQFVRNPILVTVSLKSGSNQTFEEMMGSYPMPESTKQAIASKIRFEASVGEVSDITYDGYGNFLAEITSTDPGVGVLKAFYDDQQFGEIVRPTDLNQPTTITQLDFAYEFVGAESDEGAAIRPRRDETDIAHNG